VKNQNPSEKDREEREVDGKGREYHGSGGIRGERKLK